MSNLFISHSSRDNAAARELQAKLQEQGHVSVFLDLDPETGIQAGVSWERTLYTKLRACRAVVALCSDNYLSSQWCFAEIALARMEGKELFVLQIDPWSEQTQLPSILTEEQYIDLRSNKEVSYQRLWNGFKLKGIVASEARDWKPEEPPYPGLRAFDEKDAAIFFGRDEEIRAGSELLNRVRRQGHPRLVMVLGSSGSGKSSLVRAGIVPQLRRDRGQWLVVKPFRPGAQPARELAASLSQAFEEAGQAFGWEEIHRWLEPASDGELALPVPELPATPKAEPTPAAARDRLLQALNAMQSELSAADDQVANLVHQLKDHLDGEHSGTPLSSDSQPRPSVTSPLAELATRLRLQSGIAEATVVLVVDQFEELLDHDAEHPASRFLAMLRIAMETEGSPLLVIGTMRSDYLGMLQRSVPFQGLGFKSLSVGPMSTAGMRQIIEEPAKLGQIQLENGLSDLLLEDTETSDALPLLAFTLRMMWDRYRDNRLLGIREYKELGGLQGAVAQVADETFEDTLERIQDKDARASLGRELRDAFLSMARPAAEGSGWSRQAVSWDHISENVQPALRSFIDPHRLLVKHQDGTVEVAHETLFRSWDRLKGWLNRNAEGLHLLQEIHVEARKWDAAKTDQDKEPYLWRGGRLARALELRDGGVLRLKDMDRSFVEASQHSEQAQIEAEEAQRKRELRRTRIFATVVSTAFLLSVVLGAVAWIARSNAIEQAQVADARRLSFASRTQLGVDNDLALLLAKEGAAVRPLTDFEPILRAGLTVRGQGITTLMHKGRVTYAVWNAAGTRIVSTSYGDPVTVWDATSGEPVATCSTDGTAFVAWSSGGKQLVTGSFWGRTEVWSVDGDQCEVNVQLAGGLMRAAWSPDGTRLVTAHKDGQVSIWDSMTKSRLSLNGHPRDKPVNEAAWNSDGTRIVTASEDGTARLWDASTGTQLFIVDGHPWGGPAVKSAAFSPDGGRIVTAIADGTARVSNAQDGSELAILAGHSAGLTGAAWSPGGNRIVTTSKDKTAWIWDTNTFTMHSVLVGHTASVLSAAWNQLGTYIVTSSEDGTARVWTSSNGYERAVLTGHSGRVTHAAWSPPDYKYILTASFDGKVRIWDPEDQGPQPVFADWHEGTVWRAAWSSDGSRIVTAGERDGRVRVWSLESGQEPLDLVVRPGDDPIAHTGGVKRVAWSHENSRILTAGQDNKAGMWDAKSGEMLFALEHDGGVNLAEWNASGTRIVTASEDRTARIWSADGEPEGAPLMHSGPVTYATWNAAGTRVATGATGWPFAKIWNTEDGSSLTLEGHRDLVYFVAWSPADTQLLTTSNDKTARLWDANDGSLQKILEHTSLVKHGAWNSIGTRIATVSDDKKARIWDPDPATGNEPLLVLEGHGEEPRYVAWSPDDKFIVTAAKDSTARVWNAENGNEVAVLSGHSGAVRYAAWNRAGTQIVTSGDDGSARVHILDLQLLLDAACQRTARNMFAEEWTKYMGEAPYRETCPGKPVPARPPD